MKRHLTVLLALALFPAVRSAPAANKPLARTDRQNPVVWTNNDLERLHVPGLISIVGRKSEETSKPASAPAPYMETQDPEWYAEQAAKLRDELERRQAQLDRYRQALEDARSLKTTTGGINLDDGGIAITPEAGIEILQQGVSEAQSELDALEDLARRNDIEPGTLRGQ